MSGWTVLGVFVLVGMGVISAFMLGWLARGDYERARRHGW